MKKSAFLAVLLFSLFCDSRSSPEVRESVLSGTWYPADPSGLRSTVDKLLDNNRVAKREAEAPLLLVLPHAGYIYSGPTAAAGYNLLRNSKPDIVIILAPSHRSAMKGCALTAVDFFKTPLGSVRVDRDMTRRLLKNRLFKNDRAAHADEHAIEIHLPFLQRIYQTGREDRLLILPVLVGDIGLPEASILSAALVAAMEGKKRPLFIISSDFTHYGDRFGYTPFRVPDKNMLLGKIRDLDMGAITCILKKDARGFQDYIDRTGATICGRNALLVALSLPVRDLRPMLIRYDNSARVTGDYDSTVSYAAIAWRGTLDIEHAPKEGNPDRLSPADKKFLLGLARKNLESLLSGGKKLVLDEKNVPAACRTPLGVFVTLKKKGDLRGCIGYIEGIKPIYAAVLDNSFNAAFRDPRFKAVAKTELTDIRIEISVLTTPEPVTSVGEIVVGRDGIIMEQGDRRGLLLPQVPVEWNWSREEFLLQTCRKAGLPDYAWEHGARIFRFQAIIFNEDDLK